MSKVELTNRLGADSSESENYPGLTIIQLNKELEKKSRLLERAESQQNTEEMNSISSSMMDLLRERNIIMGSSHDKKTDLEILENKNDRTTRHFVSEKLVKNHSEFEGYLLLAISWLCLANNFSEDNEDFTSLLNILVSLKPKFPIEMFLGQYYYYEERKEEMFFDGIKKIEKELKQQSKNSNWVKILMVFDINYKELNKKGRASLKNKAYPNRVLHSFIIDSLLNDKKLNLGSEREKVKKVLELFPSKSDLDSELNSESILIYKLMEQFLHQFKKNDLRHIKNTVICLYRSLEKLVPFLKVFDKFAFMMEDKKTDLSGSHQELRRRQTRDTIIMLSKCNIIHHLNIIRDDDQNPETFWKLSRRIKKLAFSSPRIDEQLVRKLKDGNSRNQSSKIGEFEHFKNQTTYSLFFVQTIHKDLLDAVSLLRERGKVRELLESVESWNKEIFDIRAYYSLDIFLREFRCKVENTFESKNFNRSLKPIATEFMKNDMSIKIHRYSAEINNLYEEIDKNSEEKTPQFIERIEKLQREFITLFKEKSIIFPYLENILRGDANFNWDVFNAHKQEFCVSSSRINQYRKSGQDAIRYVLGLIELEECNLLAVAKNNSQTPSEETIKSYVRVWLFLRKLPSLMEKIKQVTGKPILFEMTAYANDIVMEFIESQCSENKKPLLKQFLANYRLLLSKKPKNYEEIYNMQTKKLHEIKALIRNIFNNLNVRLGCTENDLLQAATFGECNKFDWDKVKPSEEEKQRWNDLQPFVNEKTISNAIKKKKEKEKEIEKEKKRGHKKCSEKTSVKKLKTMLEEATDKTTKDRIHLQIYFAKKKKNKNKKSKGKVKVTKKAQVRIDHAKPSRKPPKKNGFRTHGPALGGKRRDGTWTYLGAFKSEEEESEEDSEIDQDEFGDLEDDIPLDYSKLNDLFDKDENGSHLDLEGIFCI